MGAVLSEKLSIREIAPADAGAASNDGERLCVTPARENETDVTAAAGEYVTLILKAWIFEPAGLSTPSAVPDVSRTNTGTSTVGPSAVTVPTVMTSCAAAAPAMARPPRTAMRIFFIGSYSPLPAPWVG